MERKYIITTKNGMFVGLFNFGRTYQAAKTKRIVKCTPNVAQILAQTFCGSAKEVI